MKTNLKILIVDDEQAYIDAIQAILNLEGYRVDGVTSGRLALQKIKEKKYGLVLTDLMMPEMDGMTLLKAIKKNNEACEVIIFTGYGSIKNAVEAMKNGAFGYYVKGHDPQELINEVDKVAELKSFTQEEVPEAWPFILESKNPLFITLMETLKKASKSDVPIIIAGEPGLEKKYVAQYLHAISSRAQEAFVQVSCKSLSEEALEKQLWGDHKRLKGALYEAKKGVLYLEDIDLLSPYLQSKLSRFLDQSFKFRLIATSQNPLEHLVNEGVFQEKLYEIISGVQVTLPPLRQRKEDLPLWINYFLSHILHRKGVKLQKVEEGVIDALLMYDYPGNLLELESLLSRLIVLCKRGRITIDDLPEYLKVGELEYPTLKAYREQTEKIFIIKTLEKYDYHMTQTAEALGISRRQLFNKIEAYEIKK